MHFDSLAADDQLGASFIESSQEKAVKQRNEQKTGPRSEANPIKEVFS